MARALGWILLATLGALLVGCPDPEQSPATSSAASDLMIPSPKGSHAAQEGIGAGEQAPREHRNGDASSFLEGKVVSDAEIVIEQTGWLKGPTQDRNGHYPQDVVASFLRDIDRGDWKHAESWWYDDHAPVRPEKTFQEFVKQLHGFQKATVGAPRAGKSGFYTCRVELLFSNPERGRPFFLFDLHIVDNEWKIYRNISW